MKRRSIATLGLWMSGLFLAAACRADNPIIQTKFTADPAPMVYHDTVYLYTSHDEDDARGFQMRDWRCYTTRTGQLDGPRAGRLTAQFQMGGPGRLRLGRL